VLAAVARGGRTFLVGDCSVAGRWDSGLEHTLLHRPAGTAAIMPHTRGGVAMRKPRVAILGSALVAGMLTMLSAPIEALAWGNAGHEAVAYVAWQQMTPKARTEALALIKLVPRLTAPPIKDNAPIKVDGYAQWAKKLPADATTNDKKAMYLFMRAATWPDAIKHVGFKDSDDPPPHDAVDAPVGFSDGASHGYWHFVDKGMTSDASTVLSTPTPNAAVQIVELRKDLSSGTNKKVEAYELVWLEHLVGDIHQPLHGVRRFVANKSDLGGNEVRITLPPDVSKHFAPSSPAKLHAFWDDLPGVSSGAASGLAPAAKFAQGLGAADANDVQNTDPQHWADESFEIAKQQGYVDPPVGPKNTTSQGTGFAMTTAYYDQALGDAKTRVALAGARLAKMLNDTWPDAPAH
jgi:S1/P1 nuclease